MKKTIAYKVDMYIHKDDVIQECQCECAVGQGPAAHCKHVATTIFALTKFCHNGEIHTEMTCTQVLQKFHQAKAHKGSPVKTRHLTEVMGRSNGPQLYDPRVNKISADKIQHDTRNIILNWPNMVPRLSYLQSLAPARMRAVALDHDYLTVSMEHQFLMDEKMVHISDEHILEIEEATRGQASSVSWMRERQKRITASNFGTIAKSTESRNMNTLVRNLLCPPHLTSKAIQHGRKHENVAVIKFEEEMGIKTEHCGLFISKDNPMLVASPDRVIDVNTLLEVKCPYSAREVFVNTLTVPYLVETPNGIDIKRDHIYHYQVQGQLYCSNRNLCKLVIYTWKGIVVVDVHRDDAFIKTMLAKLLEFYENHYKCAMLNRFLFKNEESYYH